MLLPEARNAGFQLKRWVLRYLSLCQDLSPVLLLESRRFPWIKMLPYGL